MQTRKRSAENGRRQGETAHTPSQYGTYRTAKRPVWHCKTARMAVQDMGFGSLKNAFLSLSEKKSGPKAADVEAKSSLNERQSTISQHVTATVARTAHLPSAKATALKKPATRGLL